MFSISFWLFLIGILLLLIWIVHQIRKDEDFDKIPGPKGIFFLGNALLFLSDSVTSFRHLRHLAQTYRNKFKLQNFFRKGICIYSPEDAEVLLSGNKFTKKGYIYKFLQPWLNDGLLLSYGNKWAYRRKILTPAFHFNILRHYSRTTVTNCNKLIKQLEVETDKDKTAVQSFIDDFTLKTICETAMGSSLDGELNDFGKKYKNAIHELRSILHKRITTFWLHSNLIFKNCKLGYKHDKLLDLISSFRNRVIQTRKNEPLRAKTNTISISSDGYSVKNNKLAMLDILLKTADDENIDDDGICEEVDTFIFEGHDTTSSALQFAFMLLANHQNVQDKVFEELEKILDASDRAPTMNDLPEMKYLECCIKESLRLYPPVHFITRRVDERIQLKDNVCPAGVEMMLLIYDLHRQPDQFPDPLKYKPERFMTEPTWHRFAYVPFSAGPRNCIGQKFAMIEMKLVISSVLLNYRLLPITTPEDILLVTDIILRPRDPIYVKFEKRIQNKTV